MTDVPRARDARGSLSVVGNPELARVTPVAAWRLSTARGRYALGGSTSEYLGHYHEIYRQLATLEFLWDINQALSFALFRTYTVPRIGQLLRRGGEFIGRPQKRWDDTALILDAELEHGFDHPTGRVRSAE